MTTSSSPDTILWHLFNLQKIHHQVQCIGSHRIATNHIIRPSESKTIQNGKMYKNDEKTSRKYQQFKLKHTCTLQSHQKARHIVNQEYDKEKTRTHTHNISKQNVNRTSLVSNSHVTFDEFNGIKRSQNGSKESQKMSVWVNDSTLA